MNKIRYSSFDCPTQLKFWSPFDPDDVDNLHEGQYIGGIGYGDIIICGECGGVLPIDEIYETTPDDVQGIIIYDQYWVSLSETIMGDE